MTKKRPRTIFTSKNVYSCFLLSLFLISPQIYGYEKQNYKEIVDITTMNIAWYGNTKFHSNNLEQRDQLIQEFIENDLNTTEIFLFQEITKPEQFEKVLPQNYNCVSYDFRGLAHQYVVTCYDTQKYERLDHNDDLFSSDRTLYISNPKDRLRDVLVVSLKSKNSGHVINTFNLHLKAGIDDAAIRREQTSSLLHQLESMNIPKNQTIILGGDFNSYIRNINGQKNSEIEDFLILSQNSGFNFYTRTDKPTTLANTQKIFDFLMIKTKNRILDYMIHPICNKPLNPKNQFNDFIFYKDNISDHCPVTTTLGV